MRKFIRKLRKHTELKEEEPAVQVEEREITVPLSTNNGELIEAIRDEEPRTPSATGSRQGAVFTSKETRGLQVLKEPEEPDDIEVIFIHGLTGDSHRTWLHPSGVYWPTDLLPEDIVGARILSFGYDADVTKIGAVGQGSLRNHASTLVAEYAALQVGNSKRPKRLILIAHSLGGLVAKKALCVSAESAYHEHRALDQNTVGLLFIGTPHRGSDLASYAAAMARVLKLTGKRVNDVIVGVLRPDSEDVQESFGMWAIKNQSRCSLACFYEEHELSGVGMVVPKKSAILEGCIPLPIPSNHRDMARFPSRKATGYARILGQIKSILSTQDSLEEIERSQVSRTNEAFDTWRKWLKILAFPEMYSRENSIPTAAADTCSWVFKHTNFERWHTTTKPQVLWILGHPGTGKSTLMKYISQWPYESGKDGSRSQYIASFYFYNLGSKLQRTVNGLLRSILFQLLDEFPNCLDGFSKYEIQLEIDAKEEQLFDGMNLLELLENTLRSVLEVTPVWLFIDALDECRNDTGDPDDETEEVRGLIRNLKNLQLALGSLPHALRICCSCRHYPSIASKEDELKIFTEMENVMDIKKFIERELQEGIGAAEADVTVRLQNAIAKSALGSFQWTKLVTNKALSMHRAGKSTAQITRQIQTTPQQLSTLYETILKSIPREDRRRSLQLFQWACFSEEPLSLAQLRILMNVQLEPEAESYSSLEEHPDFIESEVQMERLVRSLSGGLAILQHSDIHPQSSSRSSFSSQTYSSAAGSAEQLQSSATPITASASNSPQQLYLIHQSVKDYLFDQGLAFLDDNKKPKESIASYAHFNMAFTYAMLHTMTDVTVGLRNIESSYGSDALLYVHKAAALDDEISDKCFHLVYDRAKPEYRLWLRGIDTHNVRAIAYRLAQVLIDSLFDRRICDGVAMWTEGDEAIRASSPLKSTSDWDIQVLSFHHMKEATSCQNADMQQELLRSLKPRLIATSSKLLSLQMATYAGQDNLPYICSGILELVDDKDGWYCRSALVDAAYFGSTETMEELLRRQVPGITENCCALKIAVDQSQPAAAELLLKAGFDPNRTGQTYGKKTQLTVLGIAASQGDKDMCSLLLRYGASVNLPDANGWTPLVHAMRKGNRSVCELLVSHSAHIGGRDIHGQLVLDHCGDPELRMWLVELAATHYSRNSSVNANHVLLEDMRAKYKELPRIIWATLKGKEKMKTTDIRPRMPPAPLPWLSRPVKEAHMRRAVKALLIRKGAVLEQNSAANLNTLSWAVGGGWQPDFETVKILLARSKRILGFPEEASDPTPLDWALDYYAYIKAELGPCHPAVQKDVIWLEPPYHPRYHMEPPLKLTPGKAAQAYEESRSIVRTLRGIGILCRECMMREASMVNEVFAAGYRRGLDVVERAPEEPE
ncbi:hypothetical protein NUW58_g1738 [Xylaria curta]|uniref:Uncharacterized protein n=1 Tax=Xylaria curta TaxID=42375 RepID=A0ACC1PK81_9PEZI|nr:hypothetical protein NUW58_g1738 [Xylaria curta]